MSDDSANVVQAVADGFARLREGVAFHANPPDTDWHYCASCDDSARALAKAVVMKIRGDGYLPGGYCEAVLAQIEGLGRAPAQEG